MPIFIDRGAPMYARTSNTAPIHAGTLRQIAPCLLWLPISGTIFGVKYEWDNGKAAANLRKHGVDFVDAIVALEDTNRVEEIDARFAYAEERRLSEWLAARCCS